VPQPHNANTRPAFSCPLAFFCRPQESLQGDGTAAGVHSSVNGSRRRTSRRGADKGSRGVKAVSAVQGSSGLGGGQQGEGQGGSDADDEDRPAMSGRPLDPGSDSSEDERDNRNTGVLWL